MKAVTYQGSQKIEVKDVSDPQIKDPEDVIIKITSTAICGSDLIFIWETFPYRKDILLVMSRWVLLKR